MNISGVELSGFLEEGEARVGVHHILNHAKKVLWHEVVPNTTTQHSDKARGHVVAGRDHSVGTNYTVKLFFKLPDP